VKSSHLFDPEHISVLEAEDRKVWQNPDEILNAVKIEPSFAVVDLGCGSGYFTVPLARRVKMVYAIDVQKEMLDFLKDKIKKQNIKNVKPLLTKPNEIPLESDSVDLLVSVNTVHEFDDKAKIIKEMSRVVKKNGKLLIVDFQKKQKGFGPPVEIRVSKTRAIKLFAEGDFGLSTAKLLPYHYLLVFIKE